jgi:hypothetical protein
MNSNLKRKLAVTCTQIKFVKMCCGQRPGRRWNVPIQPCSITIAANIMRNDFGRHPRIVIFARVSFRWNFWPIARLRLFAKFEKWTASSRVVCEYIIPYKNRPLRSYVYIFWHSTAFIAVSVLRSTYSVDSTCRTREPIRKQVSTLKKLLRFSETVHYCRKTACFLLFLRIARVDL